MLLPSNEYTFHFSVVGERTKHKYEGHFTVKCLLSIDEIRQVGIAIDLLNGGSQTLPAGVARLNRSLAELDFRIEKSPSWWTDNDNGRKLLDTNVIFELFLKALEAETEYDKRITEAAKAAEESIVESTKPKAKSK